MITIKLAAYSYSCAYSWVFDPSQVSHSIPPKTFSDGEQEEQQQQQQSRQQPQQLGQCQV
jgi:hypothetical protein